MSAPLTAVAMSGGVDSSVAAGLLAKRGRRLVGLSMQLVDRLAGEEDRYGRCCSPDDFRDARSVATRLGFPYYVLDMEDEFRREVLEPFAEDYAEGRTPSPCVRCNSTLKFGALLDRARALGAERVATGHYAILEPDASGRTLLRRAADREKDQSYFLFDLTEEQRRAAEMPLGPLTKEEVRRTARDLGLANAEKPESMDLCFVTKGETYRDFLGRSGLARNDERGAVVDRSGSVIGSHEGIGAFTVGQRRGLGVASDRPLYVLRIEPASRTVVVGEERDLLATECTVERVNWIPFESPKDTVRALVKVRSRHAGAWASIDDREDGTATIRFDEPQRALTPGQAAVFYDGDLVLGGGWIAR